MFLRRWRAILFSDAGLLIVLALSRIVLHLLTNNQLGFHRDELGTLDDAHYLAWGYVTYPPLTPFIGRMALELFGLSVAGVRFFSGLAQGVALVLAGLMARELGGKRLAVLLAGAAVWIAPISLGEGALFQYVSFDYLWWTLAAYAMVRLLKADNPRWWLVIGAAIGLGMLTKYTMAFFALAIAGAVLLTPARRYLRSPWLWGGAGLALLIFLPNLIWQAQNQFISLAHLSSIHARDVQIGRADNFISDQFLVAANPTTLPLWLAGLVACLFAPHFRRWRALGWMYLIPLALFILSQGRGYYLAAAYPMLLAAGAVWGEGWLAGRTPRQASLIRGAAGVMLGLGAVLAMALVLPIAPLNSAWWELASAANSDLKEEVGWPELAQRVAEIRAGLPEPERTQAGIFANNYGEAGALNLYGPALGLPTALSGVNSYWLRGYGNPPPQTLIVVGFRYSQLSAHFETCQFAGQIPNPYHLDNEEAKVPEIFICRGLRQTWPEFWKDFQHFG